MTYEKNFKISETIVPQALMVLLLFLLKPQQIISRHPLCILSKIALK